MKHILLAAALFVGGLAVSSSAFAQDDRAARIQAAEAYERVVPVSGLMDGIFDEMGKNPQLQGLTQDDLKALRTVYDYEELREMTINSMADNFTVAEINALTDFYSSPEGRSVMEKMPKYMSDTMPFIQQKSIEALRTVMQEKAKKNPKAVEFPKGK